MSQEAACEHIVNILLTNEDGEFPQYRLPEEIRSRQDLDVIWEDAWREAVKARPPFLFAVPDELRNRPGLTPLAGTVQQLIDGKHCWTNRDGMESPITLQDILVIAPYNAQVNALKQNLPDNARVGTVDKFQGQEAPIVIYSMTNSSASDAPRGMDFLFSRNRMNVATSRARCLVLLVGSPKLFQPDCVTPEQIRLANGFCRYRELVEEIAPLK
jgi:hypothetical protein